jgi:hypothetical protein
MQQLFKEENHEDLIFESTNSKFKYAIQIIPMSANNKVFQKRSKRDKWIELLLSRIVVDGKAVDGFECIAEYMMKYHEQQTREVLHGLGITPKVMDKYDTAAILNETGIGISVWREIVRCLKMYMRLCVPERKYSSLVKADDLGKINTGVYQHRKKDGERF